MNRLFSLVTALVVILAASASVYASGDNIIKKTYLYSVKGVDSLYLDLYESVDLSNKLSKQESKPCVIFMFGGGFHTGRRDRAKYMQYINTLASNGYVVASIDYRLGLKEIKNRKAKIKEFSAALFNAIDIATEDLYSATNFLLSKSVEFNINPKKIIISGSSAGAIASLTAEYYNTNWRAVADKENLSKRERSFKIASSLPKDFKYAGVIAFAGALASKKEDIKWDGTPAPILMFHGDADCNVPYYKMKSILGNFFGSLYLSNELVEIGAPHYLISKINSTHTVAESPMRESNDIILDFLDKWVLNNSVEIKRVSLENAGDPIRNKKFGVRDFVKSNFVGENLVKVVSYNIHNSVPIDKERVKDHKRISNIIEGFNPSVVALQELDSATQRTPYYMLGEIAKETKMYATYGGAIEYQGGKYGIGVLSKEAPMSHKLVPLPGREEQRALLITEFKDYIFCCTHLSLTKEDRLASVAIIKREIDNFLSVKGRENKMVIIAGDFNCYPASPTFNAFAAFAKPISNIKNFTFSSKTPDRCIDYIFVYNYLKKAQVIECGVGVMEDKLASDHLPIFSTITY